MSFDERKHPRAKSGQFAEKLGAAPDTFLLGAYSTAEDARNFTELKYIYDRDIDIYDDPEWKRDVRLAILANTTRLSSEGVTMRDEHREFVERVNAEAHPLPADLIRGQFPTAEVVNVRRYDDGRVKPVLITDGNDEVLWGIRGKSIPGLSEAVRRVPASGFVKTGRNADYRPERTDPQTDHNLGYFELAPDPVILKEFPEATNVHAIEQGGVLVLDYAETDDDMDESFLDISEEASAAVAASWTPDNHGKWEPYDDQSRWVLRVAPFPDATYPWPTVNDGNIDILDNDMGD